MTDQEGIDLIRDIACLAKECQITIMLMAIEQDPNAMACLPVSGWFKKNQKQIKKYHERMDEIDKQERERNAIHSDR